MSAKELTARIKKFALEEAGFDLVGVAEASLPDLHLDALGQWVTDGFSGSMEYMARSASRRADPAAALSSVKSVISLAVNYYHPEDPRPAEPAGKIAKYAYGADYHGLIEKKLKSLSKFILETAGPGAEVKSYVDTGPVLEKAFANRAGLGFFGKNTNLITRDYGSWVFLASLLTNLELEADAPHAGSCGSCRICIDACPTGALVDPYRLDARRCISYLTIEAKEDPPADLAPKMGEWIFGCDICQDVCPYNFRAKTTRHAALYPERKAGTWLPLKEVEGLDTDEKFRERFSGSPLKRPKRKGLLRSAKVVENNLLGVRGKG